MSRSGEIFKPWRTMSSPVLTMMVSRAGSITSQKPKSSFEAPTPPASAVILSFGFEGMENSDASGVGRVTRESIGIGDFHDAITDTRGEKSVAMEEFGIDGEAFAQGETAGFGFSLQAGNLGPGSFRIDEIPGNGRNAAPIVDASFEQSGEIVVAQVRGSLDVHVRAENQPGDGDGAQHVFQRRLWMRGHGNFRLGAKILDDHFLDVTVFFVQRSNGEERFDALLHGFADADQDPGGKRDGELARFFDGAEAQRGNFVRSLGVGQAVTHQAGADVFEHQADAGVGIFQASEGGNVHDTRIGMWEQAGFIQDEFAHGGEIVERARETLSAEEFAGFGENLFGLIAEAEEGFLAASLAASLGKGKNFIRGHEVSAGLAGILAEGAVATIVAAQSGERDEDFFGEGDDGSFSLGAEFGGGGEEVGQRRPRSQQDSVFARYGMDGRGHLGR